MKTLVKNAIGGTALGLVLAQGALADSGLPGLQGGDRELLEEQFAERPATQVEVLDAAQMRDTRGELWPFIGAVVTVDLALATFFWGTYVPAVTGTSPSGGLLTPNPY